MAGKPTYEELEQRVREFEVVKAERKEAEKELRTTNRLLEAVLDGVTDIIGMQNPDHTIVRYNKAGYEALNLTQEEVVGKTCFSLLGRTAICENCATARALKSKKLETFEWFVPELGRHLLCRSNPVLDDKEQVCLLIEQLHDITKRKLAEEALIESENRHRFITEWMTDVVWIMDLDLRTTYVSPSVTRMFGFTPEERMQQEATEIMTPESYSKVMSCFAREIEKDEKEDPDPTRPVKIDAEFYHKDGHTVWVESVVRPIRDHDGSITGIHGVSRDITERRLAEAELRLNEEKASRAAQEWRTTFNAANDAIWILDQDQRILRANQTAERLFNRPLPELVGKHCFEIVHGTAQPIPECPLLRAKDSLRRERMELQIGGGWFEVTVDPILDAAGLYAGVVHIVSDITERKLALEALRESERKFRTLADNIPGVVYLCRNDERYSMSYLNSAVEELTGYAREEFLEDRISFVDLYHPEDKPTIIQAVNDALARRESFHLVYRIRHKDGLYRWVEEWGIGVYDGDELKYLEGLVADITRRKEAEQALQESETKYKFLP